MSLLRNLLGNFMPHFEARTSTGTLVSATAALEHDLNGDDATIIDIGAVACNLTYTVEGSADGTSYFPLLCFPYGTASLGGTIPMAGQPLITEAVNATGLRRVLSTSTGQLKRIRVRVTAYTSGGITVTINSDSCEAINPYANDLKAATLMVTATGAAAAAVTATLPAVAGLRHYIDRIDVTRSASTALTANAAPALVTTTNIPGLPSLTFGSNAAAIGDDKTVSLDFGASGMAATAAGVATTVVCPVATGVIWRINVAYRLGM
jgi:hypothetical protein